MFWRRYGIKGRNRTLKLSLRVFLLVFIMYCIVSLSQAQKPKAVIVVLCRNSDLVDIRSSMRELEARFNHKFQYPYVFLNNEPFTQDFMDGTLEMTESLVEYGQIPPSHWEVPRWINQSLAQESYQLLNNRSVSYWNSTTYRQMCRYFSGFFFRHELLDKYDYYWRLEPGVHFYCDIDDDPFMILERERKDYGYAIVMPEEMPTIESLVDHALDWDSKQPKKAHPMLPFFVQNDYYNGCHFWSNFEIARLDLWRNKRYISFFEHLDQSGGFFYERWGDAPVHTLYLALTVPKTKLRYFREHGYSHGAVQSCDFDNPKCQCSRTDYIGTHCWKAWDDFYKLDLLPG